MGVKIGLIICHASKNVHDYRVGARKQVIRRYTGSQSLRILAAPMLVAAKSHLTWQGEVLWDYTLNSCLRRLWWRAKLFNARVRGLPIFQIENDHCTLFPITEIIATKTIKDVLVYKLLYQKHKILMTGAKLIF